MIAEVHDTELDNTKKTVVENEQKINKRLATIATGDAIVIKVAKVECYPMYTDFILNHHSITHQEKVKKLFPNQHRFAFHEDYVQINLADEDPEYSSLGEYFPATRKTMVLRRHAFKKLRRPIIVTIVWRLFLSAIIGCCLYGIYLNLK